MSYTPDPDNLRVHPDRNKRLIRQSLEEVGPFRSIAIDGDGIVRAGNGVYEQAQALGLTIREIEAGPLELIAVKRPDLVGDAARRAAFYDNAGSDTSYFDAELLRVALEHQPQTVKGILTDEELAGIIGDAAHVDIGGAGDEFDTTPEDGPTRTQVGELWEIDGGRHRLLVGDCTDAANVERLMGGERAAAIVTDPPYGIDASSMTMGKGQSDKPRHARLSFGQQWDSKRPDIRPLLEMSERVCIWGGNYFADVLPITNDWLCWWKKNDARSFSEFELAWTNFGCNARHLAHHWGGEEKEHITQKPIAVMVFSIEQCPCTGIILDPFAGSGTTLIAAHQMGRRAFLCEIDPRYADVVLARAEAAGLSVARHDHAPA